MSQTLAVILQSYNYGRFVGQAIDAVTSQSRPPDQFIIVDDGSTDDSVAVIEAHIQGIPYVHFERLPENTKGIGARRRSESLVQADYLYAASADDRILPGFFESAMEAARLHPQAGLIFGDFVCHDADGQVIFRTKPPVWRDFVYAPPRRFLDEYLRPAAPDHSQSGATIYRTAAWREHGSIRPELLSWRDTFSLWCIGLASGACYLPRDCMVWRVQQQGLSMSIGGNPLRMLDIIGRGAWLMRCEAYRSLFPADFVDDWEARFRELVISRELDKADGLIDAVKDLLERAHAGCPPGRMFLARTLVTGLELVRRALRRVVGGRLRRYGGDLSCLTRP